MLKETWSDRHQSGREVRRANCQSVAPQVGERRGQTHPVCAASLQLRVTLLSCGWWEQMWVTQLTLKVNIVHLWHAQMCSLNRSYKRQTR